MSIAVCNACIFFRACELISTQGFKMKVIRNIGI